VEDDGLGGEGSGGTHRRLPVGDIVPPDGPDLGDYRIEYSRASSALRSTSLIFTARHGRIASRTRRSGRARSRGPGCRSGGRRGSCLPPIGGRLRYGHPRRPPGRGSFRGYLADLFISIHADGNTNTTVSGFRAAAPPRDQTGRAAEFVDLLERAYVEATGLPHYPTVTRRMENHYAFNSRRYRHAIHPRTVGVILETGFLTSPTDRRVIVNDPDRSAQGIAKAVTLYLEPLLTQVAPVPQVIHPAR